MVLPTLNFLLYTHGNALQSQELASCLLDSLSEHGFVKLVGHGISDEKIDELFRWVSRSSWWRASQSYSFRQWSQITRTSDEAEYSQNKSFFALEEQHKLAIAHPGGSEPQRGFSSVGAESSAGLYRKGILKAQLTEDLHDSRVGG